MIDKMPDELWAWNNPDGDLRCFRHDQGGDTRYTRTDLIDPAITAAIAETLMYGEENSWKDDEPIFPVANSLSIGQLREIGRIFGVEK